MMSETSRAHKEKAPKKFGFAVVICSTSRYYDSEAGKHVTDESGDLIVNLLETSGHSVVSRDLIPDDKTFIEASVKRALQFKKVDAIITSGGTGITPSDVTIETVEPLVEKKLPGFGEIFRAISYDEIGSAAVMTRALAGVVQGKAVFCIPGSPNAVRLCLEKLILPEVGHVILHARER
jgi:molybdenum cofactor biosynthesis protein B